MKTMSSTRTAWLCALLVAACSSGDEPPGGGRIEHPAQPAPSAVQSAAALPPPNVFTPLDHAIAEDCVPDKQGWSRHGRAWSQNVPDRDCTKDRECGDGFCDRGRCAAIWTCWARYGQHCIDGRVAPNPDPYKVRCAGMCLEGRCRSCVSDEECVEVLGSWGAGWAESAKDAKCTEPPAGGHERECALVFYQGPHHDWSFAKPK